MRNLLDASQSEINTSQGEDPIRIQNNMNPLFFTGDTASLCLGRGSCSVTILESSDKERIQQIEESKGMSFGFGLQESIFRIRRRRK
jgi:hypothetical protein